MDTITKEIQKQHPWTLLFADDVMLASEPRDDLQKQVQSWKDQLQQYGLRLNTSKTEYMECGPRIEDGLIHVDGTELNKVNCFKYLGSKVTSTGDIDQEETYICGLSTRKCKHCRADDAEIDEEKKLMRHKHTKNKLVAVSAANR
ncbi:hypothetical protein NECAME_08237 [Necator americanus]|uniref:Reverse transcriptase domain-containing protein n=1 Tax=Necator americanus TaxID=51031 RepID=W2TIU7_NECAM|nr:hypothetical protein NECAME_08237 [Necator americanus]ETN82030.1 hypothetical protein NECAME_08237 [Necator americanus]